MPRSYREEIPDSFYVPGMDVAGPQVYFGDIGQVAAL
jgi:hypothetical protein